MILADFAVLCPQVQHDADAAELHRLISAVKADFARQQLMLERLYRLAQITSPAAVAAKAATAAAAGPKQQPRQEPAKALSAATAKAKAAPPVKPPTQQRPPSRSDSIAEEVTEGTALTS